MENLGLGGRPGMLGLAGRPGMFCGGAIVVGCDCGADGSG